jgi:hypothetical protein
LKMSGAIKMCMMTSTILCKFGRLAIVFIINYYSPLFLIVFDCIWLVG